jgi:hypothetical protein
MDWPKGSYVLSLTNMDWPKIWTFWAISSQTHLVTVQKINNFSTPLLQIKKKKSFFQLA